MGVNCEKVWRESSNYIDGDVSAELRKAIEEHAQGCSRCAAVLSGLKNIVQIYGDERMSDVPLGYGQRLHRRLEEDMHPARRGFMGWMVAFAASILVGGTFEVAKSASVGPQRVSQHSQPAFRKIPPGLRVLVSLGGKIFHLPICSTINNRATAVAMTAQQAIQDGYTPCPRCLRKYLQVG
ncbi:MAG TPA: zf-HC2 domain-containing protein [Terriglobales bacterium]|nr:zf-HC2 domain-containing protein [Terriglobales bacterium]